MKPTSEFRAAVKADCLRLQQYLGAPPPTTRRRYLSLAFRSEMLPLLLFRISHYFHLRSLPGMAGLVYRVNLLLTGSDIHPISRIGPGCLITHSVGLVVAATIGAHASLHAMVVIAPESPLTDLKDAPQLGDNITVQTGATILGCLKIANGANIEPHSLVRAPAVDEGGFFNQVANQQTFTQFSEEGET